MNYSKLFFTALVSLTCLISNSAIGQTLVGVRAGLNLTNISAVDGAGETQRTLVTPRLQVGLTLDIPLSQGFYLQPAALYSGKGFKQKGGWLVAGEDDFTANAHYVEVPINFVYRTPLLAGNIVLGAGPYVGYGMGGKWQTDGQIVIDDILLSETTGDIIFKEDIMDGEFGNYLYGKPWDYGVNVLLGYDFTRRLAIQLNGQWGVANLVPNIDSHPGEGSIRNRSYGISLGYRF